MTEDVETESVLTYQLPFRADLGFPQKTFVSLSQVIFSVTYSINPYDDSYIMDIVRTRDQRRIFRGKINEYYELYLLDPIYKIPYLIICPRILTRESIDVRAVVAIKDALEAI